MTRRGERAALIALALILVGLPALIFGYQYGLRPALAQVRTIDIVAAAPEAGGFQPDQIEVRKGERVRLRFSVPDVTHGIAIAGLDVDTGHIDPGQVKTVELLFDEPGPVTFYCNTWCSPNHWRMRGTIIVVDPDDPEAHYRTGPESDPVIDSMIERGIDIDAAHEANVVPKTQPVAAQGQSLVKQYRTDLPADLFDSGWQREHSPAGAFSRLQSALPHLTEAQQWAIVAYLWTASTAGEDLAWAEETYAKNCAACHGEDGLGDGPAAAAINARLETGAMADMAHRVASFALSPQTMAATKEIYYAKIRRGGMGTSMPAFGSIFDEEETWRLVEYLWRLTFRQEKLSPDIQEHE